MTAAHPQPGSGLSLRETREGFAWSQVRDARQFHHPWQVSATWQPRSRRWTATIKPGYVNGVPPIYRTSLREQETLLDHGINPLTGLPYFSAAIFRKAAAQPIAERTLELPLYLRPAIQLTRFRAIGSDGFGGEELPAFFAERGVDAFGADETRTPEALRLLRSIDLILHQPRLGLTSRITEEAGALTGQAFTRQVLEVLAPTADDTLRVYAGFFAGPEPIDPLADLYEEPAWDELRIATVYLLSPAGTPSGSDPDGSWTPFVKHDLFWNLRWIPARPFNPPGGDNRVPFISALYGGLAQPIVNTLTATGNDLVQQAFNRIAQSSQAGTWWTPTGGGHEAELPTPKPVLATTGASKSARAVQRRRTAAASLLQQAAQGLDPAFPYRAIGFPPARFN